MKKTKSILIALTAAMLCAAPSYGSVGPFSIKSALSTPAPVQTCLISVTAGEVLEFGAGDLERRLGLEPGSLTGVTITALPSSEYGGLFLDGVEVDAYDFLSRAEIDRLCFAASELRGNATVGLLPQAGFETAASLMIRILDHANRPPYLEGLSLVTAQNVAVSGYLRADDPDGDGISIRVISAPQRGEVSFNGLAFSYEPYHDRTGSDAFTVCAVDSGGAFSEEAVISVEIQKHTRSVFYSDMTTHPSHYAALMLHDAGIYTGRKIGGSYLFEPDEPMNRGQFLMLLINAAGLAETMTPTVNTGLPGDSGLPSWIKRYVKKAVEEELLSPELEFNYYGIPTRAEAVVLIDRASKISDVKDYPLSMNDAEIIPDWAAEAYRNLAAYRMLDLYDGSLSPAGALTNAYAADLTWQLYKHAHR